MKHLLRRSHVAVLLAAGWLAGCGSSQNASTSNGTTASTGSATPSVRFLSMDYDPVSSALQKKIVEEFNAQNKDGGKVEIDIIPWNDGHQKLQTLISGNQAPDLAIVGTRWMAEYNKAGLLADLGDADKNGVKTSEFVPGVLKAGRIDNKLVGLPAAASVRGLYYNAAMLKKAGVTPPKTWAELQTAATKIQATHPGVAGFGVQGKEVETDLYFYYFLWGAGGDILGADGKSALTSPAATEALDFELGLVKKKLTQPQPTGYNREELQDLFKAKKVAMIITGPWFAGMLKKDAPGLDFGVTFIPGKSAAVVPAVADEVVMFNSSGNKELAWKFLSYWYRDANRLAWAKASGMIPEKSTTARNPELTGDKHRAFFIAALPKGRYVPTHPNWEQMANAVSDSVQQALLGQMDSNTALQTASTKIDELAQ
ncbi:MAG: multiple sugar transport system substrate-binding protein [Abditibacteriota bacterium]|nr:multiple sugar transport system substrate-binding protein [Abditibacteriota bacterium]